MTAPAPLSVDLSRSALLIHDVVNDFVEHGNADFEAVFARLRTLAADARSAGLPVVFVAPGPGDPDVPPRPANQAAHRLVWGSKGVDVPSALGPEPGDIVIRKPRYGAFFGSGLTAWLTQQRRDTLFVCGLSLAGGVETTIRDAHNRDLTCILISDACLCRAIPDQGWGASNRDEVAKVTLSILAQRFARIVTTDEVRAALRVR